MSRHRYPKCPETGKVRYREHKDATLALRGARRAALAGGESSHRRETRSYLCPFCGGWHLTSQQYHAALVAQAHATHAGDYETHQDVA